MARVTVGEELRRLFGAYGAGELPKPEFEIRKKRLLDWSKCYLNQPLPKMMRRR